MAKQEVNEKEHSYSGCYGEHVTYEGLREFMSEVFVANAESDKSGSAERFATCIWGHAGIGKTGVVKQMAKLPIVWNGKNYPGHTVFDVPIAQFEEMGDLHGMPSRHVKMAKRDEQERWVAEEVMNGYLKAGWEVMPSAGVRTMYAPPDWVPSEAGPSILLLDDWNRASVRIIKGIMQLLQNYGMVSWKLPPGCQIVLTGNPDEQDYLVTSIDSAILTRIRSVTLTHDAKEWAVWATAEGLDPRGINFVLRYPEMMIGHERTNPRTLAQFFRDLKRIPDVKGDNAKRFSLMAKSLLDDATCSAMMVFCERDCEMILEPEQILDPSQWEFVKRHCDKMMSGKEKRVDVLGVICDRLFAYLVQPNTKTDKTRIDQFQKFLNIDSLPADMRHNVCMRLSRTKDEGKSHKWIIGNDKLTKMIMEVV